MIYDLIIVGSGPVALSCIIEAPRNLNIAVISQNYDTGYRLDSFGDKAYSESFGGGLDSWHGVLSSNLFLKFFPNNIDHYKNFYNKFYLDNKLNNEDFSMNKIFIPRKKISSKALLKQLNQKNNISLIFDKILYINDSKIISLVSDEHKYFAKKVFLAAGAVGSGKILHESGLAKLNSYIGNHINGYGKFNIPIKNNIITSRFSKHGHFKTVDIGSYRNNEFMSYKRPSIFDFKNSIKLAKYKTIYSRTKKEIYSIIIKSLSPGLFFEAFYNRYGIWLLANRANNYLQIEAPLIYQLDNNYDVLVDKSKLNLFINDIASNSEFKDFNLNTVVSGIHFYNTVERNNNIGNCCYVNEWNKKIVVADSSNIEKIGGSHHTFSVMAMASLAVKQIYNT